MEIERLKVFATAEEVELVKFLRDAPLIGITNPEPPGPGVPATIRAFSHPIEEAHRFALDHGLPEIPGYYGIDLENGEFIKAV